MPSTGSIAHARKALAAIRTLRALDGAPANTEQAATLAQWPGWGPLAPAFEPTPTGGWVAVADELDELLGDVPNALSTAAECVDNSFYTSPLLITQIYRLLTKAGFTGGRVLEPGCGAGRFISQAPSDLPLHVTGVESDVISAAIAQALHPRATIIAQPLERTILQEDGFDVAVGNVPFSSSTVYDAIHDIRHTLHEYFMRRMVMAVRPGGYVVAITSRYMMDNVDGLDAVSEYADLVAAVRLPSGAFSAEGTQVVADVLVLRVREHGADTAGWDNSANKLTDTSTYGYGYGYGRGPRDNRFVITGAAGIADARVNRYWEANPDHVAGVMVPTANCHNPLDVHTDDVDQAVTAAFDAVASHLVPMGDPDAGADFSDVTLADALGRKEGSFHVVEGVMHEVVAGSLAPVNRPAKELYALVELRDAALKLMTLESDIDLADDLIAPARSHALSLYTAYVDRFGPLNRGKLVEGRTDAETGMPSYSWRQPTMGGFRRDPDYPATFAMEVFDQDTGMASPAPILLRRVNHRPEPITRVDTAGEALSVTRAETGHIDLDRIASLLDTTRDNAVAALGDLVFADPSVHGDLVLARDYLSGNIRERLDIARAAAKHDGTYTRNVAALEAVLPTPRTRHDIRVSLGAPWLTAADLATFARQEFGAHVTIKRTPRIAHWEVDGHRVDAQAALTYGTPRMDPLALLSAGLNGKTPVVYDEVWEDGTTRKVRNHEATEAAEQKLKAIADRFAVWIWEDAERADRIVAEYNVRFNSYVNRRNDGAHLTFPGISDAVTLWPWQRDIIDQIVSTPRTFCAHAVGAGKTLSMVGAAMTLRRFGLANKPLIVVPGHLLLQIAREAQQAFPTGRFLIATKDDLHVSRRRLFAARCATGDWDAVVMTHEAFGSIPVDPELEERWIQQQKAELRAHLPADPNGTSRGSKQVAAMLRTFESRIRELRSRKADPATVLFSQLGVDFIAVDEAHLFKRLPIATRAEGFSLGSSKRATDLHLKIEALSARDRTRPHVAFFSGTPFSNTLAEAYVWQRYMQPDRLASAGIEHFDAWAAVFIRYVTRTEVAPDGSGFRSKRRPSVIQNMPELRAMLREFMDLLSIDDLAQDRPDPMHETVVVHPSEATLEYVASLVERAENIRKHRMSGKGADNMLNICGDGRKAALDPRLVGIFESSPKVLAVAERAAAIYHQDKDRSYGAGEPGGLQIIFCDLGTPGGNGSQTYGRIRAELIARGVPAHKIRWVHEAKTDKARAALFAACRDGSVSVLLGSTSMLGLGTNVQARHGWQHHLDAPWRVSDVAQREGRAIRPGNQHNEVQILRYVTESTFDAFMWETLERKARAFSRLYSADDNEREIDDLDDGVLSFAQVKALAAGNPRLLQQAELASEVRRLELLRVTHAQNVNAAKWRADDALDWAKKFERRADTIEAALAEVTERRAAGGVDVSEAHLLQFAQDVIAVAFDAHKTTRRSFRLLGLEVTVGDAYRYGYDREAYAPVEVELKSGRDAVAAAEIKRGDIRRGPKRVAAVVLDWMYGWIELAPEQLVRCRADAASKRAEAERAQAVVSAAVFAHEDALTAARAELSKVTAMIDAEAAAAEGVPAAA